jgi:hypothetical protein
MLVIFFGFRARNDYHNQIFNVGDTEVTVVQCKSNKLIGMNEKMPIASLSSAEVRAVVTVSSVCASS